MTSPSDADLVKRLRALSRHEHTDLTIGDEAADRLEAITRELAEAKADTERMLALCEQSSADIVRIAGQRDEARQKLAAIGEIAARPCIYIASWDRSQDAEGKLDRIANLAKDKTP